MRSADPTRPSPKNEIVISRSSPLIVLSPEFDPDPDIQTYRGAITTDDNRPIWRGDKLQLNLKGTIELGFSARLFRPSGYLYPRRTHQAREVYSHLQISFHRDDKVTGRRFW
jgi:hypothetical protein